MIVIMLDQVLLISSQSNWNVNFSKTLQPCQQEQLPNNDFQLIGIGFGKKDTKAVNVSRYS